MAFHVLETQVLPQLHPDFGAQLWVHDISLHSARGHFTLSWGLVGERELGSITYELDYLSVFLQKSPTEACTSNFAIFNRFGTGIDLNGLVLFQFNFV